MPDDAHIKVRERFADIGRRALARLYEIHPHLSDKSLEETTAILKAEEAATRSQMAKTNAQSISSIERLMALRPRLQSKV